MARNVYFSFHYQDVIDFRANVVRNSGKFRRKGVDFRDGSIWEEAEEKRVGSIKKLIDSELKGSGVTCVLIGSETFSRRFVRYELVKSFEQKKGQLGVGINWIKDKFGNIKPKGKNPFEYLRLNISEDGRNINFQEYIDGSWVLYKDLPMIRNSHFSENNFGRSFKFSNFYTCYSYSWDNGNKNFTKWVEEAAQKVGR
jgi:hypothetical protein